MKDRKKGSVCAEAVEAYQPIVVDVQLFQDGENHLEISGDAPAFVIENADSYVLNQLETDFSRIELGTALISWGVLTLVPFPDICQALVLHASGKNATSGDISSRNSRSREQEAAIWTTVRFRNAGLVSLETFIARRQTEVKLVRDLYVYLDEPGVH